MDELDVVGSVMTIGPSVIMGLTCLYLRQAITANLLPRVHVIRHTHKWMVPVGTEEQDTPQGRFVRGTTDAARKHRARRYGFAMFSIGISLYFVCRFLSAPGEYLGVNRLELRQTLG